MESQHSHAATLADRKVVLMRILAEAEADRLGLTPTAEQILETTRWWRNEFGLRRLESFAAWLRHAQMDLDAFNAMMRRFTALTNVQMHYATQIERDLPDHLAIHTVRHWQESEGS